MSDPTIRLNAALTGRYRIERQLGEGGMATVYLARDEKHNRNVALKVLKPELAAVVGADRFLAEIETTANLQHPHILPLFDSGAADGFLFYVMPYVEGETLRGRLDREHQLPVDEAVRLVTDVAEALEHAHARGVIHRDVKPENILLQSGKPVVSDFGIALAVGTAGGGRLTGTGMSLGTPHYMSPEQATGDVGLGPGTDVYALGCVLYEMLVGEPPYTGSTPQAILGKIIQAKPVSATEARQSVPAHVDAAIRRALEKVPADRFGSASAFARALGDASFRHGEVAGAGAAAGAAVGPWKRLAIAATTLAAVFALALVSALLRSDPPQPVTRQVLSTEGWAGLVPEFGRFSALAPDGSSMILPVESAGGATALGLKLRGSTEVTPIVGTEGVRDFVYSPDGAWIAYAIGSDVFKRPLTGGAALKLAEDADLTGRVGLAWLDDGALLYDAGSNLMRVPQDGGEPLAVLDRTALVWVHALPGGQEVLLVTSDDQLLLADLRDLSRERLLAGVRKAWYTPTGHIVYVRSDGAAFAQPFDLGSRAFPGAPVPLFDRVRLFPFMADMHLAADGTLLYAEGTSAVGSMSQLVVVDLEGEEEPLPLAPRDIGSRSLGWSPDGVFVAFQSGPHIYTYNTVLNTTPRQLVLDGVISLHPAYAPDGNRVAFSATSDTLTNDADVFVKNLNDDAQPRPVITLDGDQMNVGWVTDTLIVFENLAGGSSDLWMADVSDLDNPQARPYLTSEASLTGITTSPDGTLAAYRSDESGQQWIYLRAFPIPGERTILYRGDVEAMSWSPDGSTLYAFTAGPERLALAIRLRRGPVAEVLGIDTLFTTPLGARVPRTGAVLHPDGDRFILTRAVGVVATAADGPQRPDRLILVTNFFEELRQRAGGSR